MKKIKAFIIHLLGGLTVEESRESDSNSFDIGRFRAYMEMRTIAEERYGQDWRDEMWQAIIKETHGEVV